LGSRFAKNRIGNLSVESQSLPSTITLDQLIALNDEILALTRCGVTLERGLGQLGRDWSGKLASLSTEIGTRLERGEDLAEILGDPHVGFPPVYRAVVESGIRGGRLTAALEGLATTARRVADLRRLVGLALVYPFVVLSLACVLFAWLVPELAGTLIAAYKAQELSISPGLLHAARFLQQHGDRAMFIPVIAILLVAVWWWWSRRAASAQTARFAAATSFLPQVGHLLRVGRTATFLEVLALLVEQQVPLPEALRLAGAACGDVRLHESAGDLADRVERGEDGSRAPRQRKGIPSIVRWRLLQPQTFEGLTAALRHAADTYRRRTQHLADWLTYYLPWLLTLAIGGTATMIYVFCVMVPWLHFLHDLAPH
jgi:general secretion pathway protein F